MEQFLLPKGEREQFVAKLAEQYTVYGPVGPGEKVVFGPVETDAELRWDYDHTLLPPKKLYNPPVEALFAFKGREHIQKTETPEEKRAIIGMHPCDVKALLSLDQVYGDTYPDQKYQQRRQNTLIIALNCIQPCKYGFCLSFDAGFKAKQGFDLALTDLGDTYLVEVGSAKGQALVSDLHLALATEAEFQAAEKAIALGEAQMNRYLDVADVEHFMHQRVEHPHWSELEEQCLACGSCTHVCPTCFCYGVRDQVDLTLENGERQRFWDSCQYYNFSQVAHDHVFRPERSARIKQRLFHKLAYYPQQFDTLGCVGCGRCVATCIVKIDPVEVIAKLHVDAPEIEQGPAQRYYSKRKEVCPSQDSHRAQPALLKGIKMQTKDTATYTFAFADPKVQEDFQFDPGSFNMLSILGVGEAPISISSSVEEKGHFDHTIRAVGNLTNYLTRLRVGDTINIRGSYGAGWPIKEMQGKDVVVVAGGIGLAPLRPVIEAVARNRKDYGKFNILYGVRNPGELLFTDEYEGWRNLPDTDLLLTVDSPAGKPWTENVGVVTTLFERINVEKAEAVALVCGPGIMMKFAVQGLLAQGFKADQIFVSLERRMSCGIKKCGNCQIGPLFVCQDGPVFRYSEVQNLPEDIF